MTVTVVAIDGNRVRLGIAAPGEVAVYREEVWQRLEHALPRPLGEGKPDSGWNPPVVPHGKLFIRNGEEAACYQLVEQVAGQ